MKKHHVQLTEAERRELEALVRQGEIKNRTLKRALGLLALDDGATLQAVAKHQRVTAVTVASWRDNYRVRGLASLHDQPRPGRPPLLDGLQRAEITALACSPPRQVVPAGTCACWLTKRWNLATVRPFRTPKWARFSKKRTPAPLEAYLVFGQDRCSLSGADGADSLALRLTLRR